ncbi:hypothetical protein BC332_02018 [Capsicum chinense]|nr:hypothetical protein BC332_02018 [Capsicum chinense]
MVDNPPIKMVTKSISRSDIDAHTVPMFDLEISQSEEKDALPLDEVRGIGHKRQVGDDVPTLDNNNDDLVKEFQMFTKTCFGVYMQMHYCSIQAQLVRCFMYLEVEESSKYSLVIYVNGSTLQFLLRKFAFITGLNCVANKDDFVIENKEPNRIVSQYFGGQKTVKKLVLIKCFENREWGEGNNDDAIKIVILYFINTFIFSGEKHCVSVPKIHFHLVENDKYKDYPWGKKAFNDLVKSISKKMDAQKQYYGIYGMPLAMQVWLYKCCSAVDPKIIVKHGSRILRSLNWETTDRRPHFEAFIKGMLADVDNPVVYRNITATSREMVILQLPCVNAVEDITLDDVSFSDDFQDAPPATRKNKGKKKVDTASSEIETTEILKENPHQVHTSDDQVIEDDGVATLRLETESQYETPDELLPSLNLVKSTIIHPIRCINDTTPVPKQRNKKLSHWNFSPFTRKFGSSFGTLDYGICVAVYVEFLTGGQGVPNQEFDIVPFRTRYAALLWDYDQKKKESGTTSDDEALAKIHRPFTDWDSNRDVTIF